MAILGSHMSIAGGYYKAVERGRDCGCDCIQLFTKNNNQWRAKPILDEEAARFQETLQELNITHPLSHSSYLINLASPDQSLRKKSIDAFVVELWRAEQLGIPYAVLHPGSYTTSSEQAGLTNIIQSLDEVHRQTRGIASRCLLENTAGQGTNLGWRFEQLATLLDGVKDPERLGVCFDTCHAFAAGYALAPEKEFKATMRQFDLTVGLKRIKAFHLNDSKRELGSRVDRHEHIGHGQLGLEAFRLLLADRRFRKIPMYLETEKGENDEGEDWDVVNFRTLRSLIK
jgi:deoxyribonuclease-4